MDIIPPTPIDTLKTWFSTFKKPTQEQFWAWMHSFWHKSEKVPAGSVDGLHKVATSGSYSDLEGRPNIPQGGYTPTITVGDAPPSFAGNDGDIFILLKTN